MLRRQRPDPVNGEQPLKISRLFRPKRAVIVETAIRSGIGTKFGLPSVVTRWTKSMIDCFTAPSFQEGNGSSMA
jgi:hypothetical protein